VDFAELILDSIKNLDSSTKHFRLVQQIEASATSVSMNIAEGKGRWSKKEFQTVFILC